MVLAGFFVLRPPLGLQMLPIHVFTWSSLCVCLCPDLV